MSHQDRKLQRAILNQARALDPLTVPERKRVVEIAQVRGDSIEETVAHLLRMALHSIDLSPELATMAVPEV